jgi:hypothetical protein
MPPCATIATLGGGARRRISSTAPTIRICAFRAVSQPCTLSSGWAKNWFAVRSNSSLGKYPADQNGRKSTRQGTGLHPTDRPHVDVPHPTVPRVTRLTTSATTLTRSSSG